MNDEKKEIPQIPNPIDFYLKTPLYDVFPFDRDEDLSELRNIKFFQDPIDSFCPGCEKHSIFHNVETEVSYNDYEFHQDHHFGITFKCSRNKEHRLFYVVKIYKNTIQKIGQYPTIADLQFPDLAKYQKILGAERFREFTKGVGLSAHGVGIGSFVYLRRIFEFLVEEAHCLASQKNEWDATAYSKSRMNERIKMLESHLPDILIKNSQLYNILSKGVHELTEDECLKYFSAIKLGIELILDEKLTLNRKKKKIEEAERIIKDISSQIK